MSIEFIHKFYSWQRTEQISEHLSVRLVYLVKPWTPNETKNGYKFIFVQHGLEIAVSPRIIKEWIEEGREVNKGVQTDQYPVTSIYTKLAPTRPFAGGFGDSASDKDWLIVRTNDDGTMKFKIKLSNKEFETFKELYTSTLKADAECNGNFGYKSVCKISDEVYLGRNL
jgi:hypothetical protein